MFAIIVSPKHRLIVHFSISSDRAVLRSTSQAHVRCNADVERNFSLARA